MNDAAQLAKSIQPCDQTVVCDDCNLALWGKESRDDPSLFHAVDCPLFARRDVAKEAGFNVERIEKRLGRRMGVREDSPQGWRELAHQYVGLHNQEKEAHFRSLWEISEAMGIKNVFGTANLKEAILKMLSEKRMVAPSGGE